MMEKYECERLIREVNSEGQVEIKDGVYLWQRPWIESQQNIWPQEETAEQIDYSVAPYWVTDNAGMHPEPIGNSNDLYELMKDY